MTTDRQGQLINEISTESMIFAYSELINADNILCQGFDCVVGGSIVEDYNFVLK